MTTPFVPSTIRIISPREEIPVFGEVLFENESGDRVTIRLDLEACGALRQVIYDLERKLAEVS